MFTIIVDAGHGGSDPGAIGTLNGISYNEKTLNLDLAMKVKAFLESVKPTPKVILTRDTDLYIPVCDRGTVAKTYNADVFISLHNNSSSSPDACGTLTLYPDSAIDNYLVSQTFADSVHKNMIGYLNSQGWGMKDSGVANFRTGLGVFRCSAPIPACLTETAFLSCPSDLSKLSQEKFREDAAYGIALGIVDWLNKNKNASLSLPMRDLVVIKSNQESISYTKVIIPLLVGGITAFVVYNYVIKKRSE